MKRIAVVHLVRKKNGIEPLRRFLESYRRHEPGVEHELIFVFKGFTDELERKPYYELFSEVAHQIFEVPDQGYDIQSYWQAANRFEHKHFCFLNSFSVMLHEGWLEKLFRAVSQQGVGLAGATGSCQSLNPSPLSYYLLLSRHVRSRGPVKDLLMSLPFANHFNFMWRRVLAGSQFLAFPNYHVRTNAFMLGRDTMRNALSAPVNTKMEAYRFESSRRSLTAQIFNAGMRTVVVGADGTAYDREEWHLSDTFWQARQQNLLVSDNQTRQYEAGTREHRQVLSKMAWGEHARPD